MIAGINAALKIDEIDPLIIKRDQGYIGVLIDDLVTKGTEEPYRMFTSRAEYRILLRQDNADLRLTPIGQKLGLTNIRREKRLEEKVEYINKLSRTLQKTNVVPEVINPILEKLGESQVSRSTRLNKIISRPRISIKDLLQTGDVKNFLKENGTDNEALEQVEIQIKYAGYMEKERLTVEKFNRLEEIIIPEEFNYNKISSLSMESREKLSKIKPQTIGQASRISGVSPSDISVLLVYMGR